MSVRPDKIPRPVQEVAPAGGWIKVRCLSVLAIADVDAAARGTLVVLTFFVSPPDTAPSLSLSSHL